MLSKCLCNFLQMFCVAWAIRGISSNKVSLMLSPHVLVVHCDTHLIQPSTSSKTFMMPNKVCIVMRKPEGRDDGWRVRGGSRRGPGS